jgi:hypothetical protein
MVERRIKMRKLWYLAIIVLLIILPIGIIQAIGFLINNIGIPLGEHIPLYLTIFDIEISIILGIIIYQWQRRDEKRSEDEEIHQAKQTLNVLLINATKRAFEVYNNYNEDDNLIYDFIRITDNHIGLIATIRHMLTEEEFLYLNRLMEILKDMAEHEKNEDLYEAKMCLRKYMKLITLPFYSLYHFKIAQPSNIYDVMNEDAIEVFNLLTEKENKTVFSYGTKYDINGKILFNNQPNGYFKVYDSDGNILCNAIIDNKGIVDGKAKIFNEGIYIEYEGNFKNREKYGDGIEYFTGWFINGVKRKGQWKDDNLVTGTVYKVILDDKNEIYKFDEDTIYTQLDGYLDFNKVVEFAPDYNIANIYIDNGQAYIIKDSIVPVIEMAKAKGLYIDID